MAPFVRLQDLLKMQTTKYHPRSLNILSTFSRNDMSDLMTKYLQFHSIPKQLPVSNLVSNRPVITNHIIKVMLTSTQAAVNVRWQLHVQTANDYVSVFTASIYNHESKHGCNSHHRTHSCGQTFDTTDASSVADCSTCRCPGTNRRRG